jgi:hypothetical protein
LWKCNWKLQTETCVDWKNKKEKHDHPRVLKQTLLFSIITTRKDHRWIGRFLKIGSTNTLSFVLLGFPERERITTKSMLLLDSASSHPRESRLTSNDGLVM